MTSKRDKINLTTRKKIVYLIGTLAVGGAERQLVETAIRLDRSKFDARIYAISNGGLLKHDAEQAGISVSVHETKYRGIVAYGRKLFALYRYLRRERPDILHCFMFTPSLYGGFVSRLTGVPILITNRRSLGMFKDRVIYFQCLENIVNRFTDKVLVNSHAVLCDVLQRERITVDKLEVIYNGIDTQKYSSDILAKPQITQLKEQLSIPAASLVIGMIANLYRYKGHQELLLAIAEIIQSYPNIYALCIGEDREGLLSELQKLCDSYHIRQHVVFAGFSSDVPMMLSIMDIVVSASYEEGFSNAILEAMAAGKPVVATSVGGNPEAVIDGETGRIVPAGDAHALAAALLELLHHPNQRIKYGQNARKRIEEHFLMESMIHRIENVYDHLLREKA
ncbi:glycosyl transferase, group 1 [Candidatus Moduliflexus flocculans]|uniref:Glycosyl transferase, group 1 n=1 Tax=Candidatus Moduliflexus flocculans TaxID=1499966 RepID=A0A081BNE7_9BACT|nr:glycosyl transferase, group 1 [Candidatus Moduliflexus flocculans]